MEKFSPGDVVYLKSQAFPAMTVSKVWDDLVSVCWVQGMTKANASFHPICLTKEKPK